MLLTELTERIANLPSGGFLTDENRLDFGYLRSLIHSASAQAKRNDFARTKRVHSSWLYPYYPQLNDDSQVSNCYYKFKLPQYIAFDSRMTGIGYVGSVENNQQFQIVENRAKFSAMMKDRVMKLGKNKVLIENGYMEVYGKTTKMVVEASWYDVTELPNFNIDKDHYNIETSLIPEIEKIILQTNLVIITKSAMDTLQDKKDSSAPANISK